MESSAERLYTILREIVECCQEGHAIQAQQFGLTTAEARALVAIRFHNCQTTADLAEALFVAKSRVTRILDGMVAKSLIQRSEHADDRRLCSIRLTKKGTETTSGLMAFILELHKDVLSSLPSAERAETLTKLATLNNAMHSTRERLRRGDFSATGLR